jgi:hypothetical protein
VRKIAKQIIVCLFALSVAAFFMRRQSDSLWYLIPVGLIAFANFAFFDSPGLVAWAKARSTTLFLCGICLTAVGALLIFLMAFYEAPELMLWFPAAVTVVGIWIFVAASTVKIFVRSD